MRVNFVSSKDTEETATIYVWSNNEIIMWVGIQMILLENFLGLFT